MIMYINIPILRRYNGDVFQFTYMLMLTFMLILPISAVEALSEYDIQVATDCPPTNSHDYNVLARQLNCFNNPDGKKLHCARHSYTNKFTVKCLVPEECRQGREPYIFDNSDTVACQYCHDEDAYNDVPLQWSFQFNSCKKMTQLKPGMIICEDLRITTAEKHLGNHFFRCNTTANFILGKGLIDSPQTELKGFCTNSIHTRCIKYFCANGDLELIKNYSCVPKCLADQKRDEHTLECVSKDQTVQPLTTLGPVSQQSTKKPTTVSPFPTKTEPETTAVDQQNNGDENPTSYPDWLIPLIIILPCVFILLFCIVLCCCKYQEIRKIIDRHILKNRPPAVPEEEELMHMHTRPDTVQPTLKPSGQTAQICSKIWNYLKLCLTCKDVRPGDIHKQFNCSTYIEKVITYNNPPPTQNTSPPADTTAKTTEEKDVKLSQEESGFTHSSNKSVKDAKGDKHPTAVKKSEDREDRHPIQAETSGSLQSSDHEEDVISQRDILQQLMLQLSPTTNMEEKVPIVLKCLASLYNGRKFNEFQQIAGYISEQGYLQEFMKLLPLKLCEPKCNERKYRNIPDGFTAYTSTGNQNSCMYQSVSLQLTGDEKLANLLRLMAALHGALNVKFFAKQIYTLLDEGYDKRREALADDRKKEKALADRIRVFYTQHLPTDIMKGIDRNTDSEELNFECLKELVMETPVWGNCSSQIQAMFLCGAIGRPIQQYMQKWEEYASFWKNLDPKVFLEDYKPNGEETITIMWVNASDEPNGRINHVVPLWKENEGVSVDEEKDKGKDQVVQTADISKTDKKPLLASAEDGTDTTVEAPDEDGQTDGTGGERSKFDVHSLPSASLPMKEEKDDNIHHTDSKTYFARTKDYVTSFRNMILKPRREDQAANNNGTDNIVATPDEDGQKMEPDMPLHPQLRTSNDQQLVQTSKP